jgi:murein DD-endopeptidase MepM/ murein hydrolase activator NlpD
MKLSTGLGVLLAWLTVAALVSACAAVVASPLHPASSQAAPPIPTAPDLGPATLTPPILTLSMLTPTATQLPLLPTPLAPPSSTPGSDATVLPITSSPSLQNPAGALTPTIEPTPCSPDLCYYAGVFPLQRPISPPGTDTIEASYRFATTQHGTREPHHGVEFLNPLGTPVLAAADGVVVVAGNDYNFHYGRYFGFYGNLIVIQHQLPGVSQPVFTLYGHLSQILVQVDQKIRSGQLIGRVGLSGLATGSHLHFEVRLGEDTYASSRNPELWLMPHLSPDGVPNGGLAGLIIDSHGNTATVSNIVIAHLLSPDSPPDSQVYIDTYEAKDLTGQPPWGENFAIGDLTPGWYKISFIQFGIHERMVQVLPGQLTVVTIDLRDGG